MFISAALEKPGLVAARSAVDQLVFGEVDGSLTARCESVRQACEQSGIRTDLFERIIASIWEKFVSIVGINVVCCLARQSAGFIRADERLSNLRAMVETVSVARALRLDISVDTVDRALAFGRHVAYDTRVSML